MQWNRGGHAKRAAELTRQLSAERLGQDRLRIERDHQAELAQRALADAAQAREAREDVRRVLAAAVAAEQRAKEEVLHVRQESVRVVGEIQQAERVRGEAQGQLQALELRLVEERQAAERLLRDAHDRAWALSSEHTNTMQRLIAEREEARGGLVMLSEQLPLARRAATAWAVLAVATVLLCLAALLVPGLLGRLAGDERAHALDGFTALDANMPLYLFAGLCVATVGLMAWGLVLLRGKGNRPMARAAAGQSKPAVGKI